MRVSEAINFNRRLRTPFIKPSNISARNPLSQLSNSKHFIKLCAAANLREIRCNAAGNWLLNYAPLSHSAPQKSLCSELRKSCVSAGVRLLQWRAVFKVSPALVHLLCQLAVGCCDKASGVVNVTPHHIVGEVWLQDQELWVHLELKVKSAHFKINIFYHGNISHDSIL